MTTTLFVVVLLLLALIGLRLIGRALSLLLRLTLLAVLAAVCVQAFASGPGGPRLWTPGEGAPRPGGSAGAAGATSPAAPRELSGPSFALHRSARS